MARFDFWGIWRGRPAVLPPITDKIELVSLVDADDLIDDPDFELEPISAFLCIVEYDGENRLVTCRRYDGIGENRYVGAICHQAKGYRQFRCDRIGAVYDAQSGELIGDGSYFARFTLDGQRKKAPTWGLMPSQKMRLIAGLNALSFMARCDGHWHNLESSVIEQFIVSIWLRMEWPGDPDIAAIMAHTERLAPDSATFFKALELYSESSKLGAVMRRAIGDLIVADGKICSAEMDWATEVTAYLGNGQH